MFQKNGRCKDRNRSVGMDRKRLDRDRLDLILGKRSGSRLDSQQIHYLVSITYQYHVEYPLVEHVQSKSMTIFQDYFQIGL